MSPTQCRSWALSLLGLSLFNLISSYPVHAQSAPQGVTWATRKATNSQHHKTKSSPIKSKPKKSSKVKKRVATTRYDWSQPSLAPVSSHPSTSKSSSSSKKKTSQRQSKPISSAPKQSSSKAKVTTVSSSSTTVFSAPSRLMIGQLRLVKTNQVPSGQFADFVVMGNRLYGIERKGSSVYLRNVKTGAKVVAKQSSQTLSGLVIEVYANNLAKIGTGRARVDRMGRLTNRQLYNAACYCRQ